MSSKRKPRAIDLYSGVGGWSLGLRLAGIDVVASYDWSGSANETNFKNNHHQAQTVNVRRLTLDELPSKIDIVVGSPPCTQFSFSNRGGNGDIDDGLKDVIKFFQIVDHLRPAAWAMENVPRVAEIIERELGPRGRLRRFCHLGVDSRIINMEQFGLPQRRTRCIVGNLPFDLLLAYSERAPRRTLGDVVQALRGKKVRDPIYGISLPCEKITDHLVEEALNAEQIRINRANKLFHPVYNSMPFPDPLSRSVRTITSVCTRVSRESVVIADMKEPGELRRLTVRERASLQGFPITFQFYGSTYRQKQEMVGNAIPPLFTYYLGHAMRRSAIQHVVAPSRLKGVFQLPANLAESIVPDKIGTRYPLNRRFRFAIPTLHLKSGVRFELSNEFAPSGVSWRVNFFFGTSKSIHSIVLERSLEKRVLNTLPQAVRQRVEVALGEVSAQLEGVDVNRLQRVWAHRGPSQLTPFMLLDLLDEAAKKLMTILSNEPVAERTVLSVVRREFGVPPVGVGKLTKNAQKVVVGLLLGSRANMMVNRRKVRVPSRLGRSKSGSLRDGR